MTTLLVDLISQTRIDFLDDTEGPPEAGNWSNLTITNALNQAQREIARRCLLISDYTSEICSLTLAADVVTGLYPQSLSLSSKILRVRYVLFPIAASASKTRELYRRSTERLNALHGRWQWIGKTGRVESFVTDLQRNTLTFDHQPLYGGTVSIGVYRLPLVDMDLTDDASAPEIQEYDIEIIHGALKYLYSKGERREDKDTYDPIKEAKWRKLFEEDIIRINQDQAAMCPKETVVEPADW